MVRHPCEPASVWDNGYARGESVTEWGSIAGRCWAAGGRVPGLEGKNKTGKLSVGEGYQTSVSLVTYMSESRLRQSDGSEACNPPACAASWEVTADETLISECAAISLHVPG